MAGPSKKSERDTLSKLRGYVEDLELRLNRANSLTRQSVTALKNSFENLNARASSGNQRTEQMASHIDTLSVQLNDVLVQTRQDVAHDLQVIMDDPRIEVIRTALNKANQRLTKTEAELGKAIGAVNEQIANLATAIDDRIAREVRARQRSQQILETKLADIETNSAKAIKLIGAKVMTLTDDLRSDFEDVVDNKTDEHTKTIDRLKSEVSRRIEIIEDDQRNALPSLERRMVTLATRLEVLEDSAAKAASTAKGEVDAFTPPPAPEPQTTRRSAPPAPLTLVEPMPNPYETAQPTARGEAKAFDEGAAAIALDEPLVLENTPEPTQQPLPPSTQKFTPTPFDPKQFVPLAPPENTQSHTAPPHTPNGTEEFSHQGYVLHDYDSHSTDPNGIPDHIQPGAETLGFEPQAGANAMPPFDGGQSQFAEPLAQSMAEARPGTPVNQKRRTKFRKKPRGTKNPALDLPAEKPSLRGPLTVGALMVGVALTGLFAAKTVLPMLGDKDKPAEQHVAAGAQSPSVAEAPQSVETVEPVGDYSASRTAPKFEGSSAAGNKLTLASAAEGGNKAAQFQQGLVFLEAGENEKAVRMLRLAAKQGQPAAQYRLGKMYESGLGVKANLTEARKWIAKAADGGNRIAMHDLGHYLATGADGSPPDINKAVSWFQQAADRGVLDSQFNLGVLYHQGSGLPQSFLNAYVWYSIAAAQGDTVASQRREIVGAQLSSPQLNSARKRIDAFKPMRLNEEANGIFKDLPWTEPERSGDTAAIQPSIKSAQSILAELGYDIGTPDGELGPRTRNAIIRFERANGLPETGRVDASLMDRLKLASGT